MKILSLNCQKNHHPELETFLNKVLNTDEYDFLLLQEASREVISYLSNHNSYGIVVSRDKNNHVSLVSVVYHKKRFVLKKEHYLPFHSNFYKGDAIKHTHSYGLVMTSFIHDKQTFHIGSMHLPAGLDRSKRLSQITKSKQELLNTLNTNEPIIFGGDCNFGLPGTLKKAQHILEPDYHCVTGKTKPTLDSYYTEHLNYLTNHLAYILRLVGVHIKLHTDHIFVNTYTKSNYSITPRVLHVRVSDHSPIELVITDHE